MNLIEISEREVIEAAKAWALQMRTHGFDPWPEESALLESVTLLEERERVAQALDDFCENPQIPSRLSRVSLL